jgi:nucleoside-diphosphate-sugar epimerase
LKSKSTLKRIKRTRGAKISWGDITDYTAVLQALQNVDIVIHNAFAVDPLETVPSEQAKKVDINGSENLIKGIKAQKKSIHLFFSSSVEVYGLTFFESPPITINHKLNPATRYAKHKKKVEDIIINSGLLYTIFRISASPPIDTFTETTKGLTFEIDYNNRCEFIHCKDVALAYDNAIKKLDQVAEKIFIIGGGKNCQITWGELISAQFKAIGFKPPEPSRFGKRNHAVDWYDTTESEKLLNYQTRTLNDHIRDIRKIYPMRHLSYSILGKIAGTKIYDQIEKQSKSGGETDTGK